MVAKLDTPSLSCRRFLLGISVLLAISYTRAAMTEAPIYLDHIKNYCTGTCSSNYVFNDTAVICQKPSDGKTGDIQTYTCDLANKTDQYRLIIHKSLSAQMLYKTLHIRNAGTVELQVTAIADEIMFTNVQNIFTEKQSFPQEVFRSLTLTNTFISELTFSELEILKLENSTANLVNLPNLQEMDIIDGSVVHNLSARISAPKSTFSDSTIREVSSLEVEGKAVLSFTNMTVGAIRSMRVHSGSTLSMKSSQVDEIDRLEILTNNATMDGVVVGDIMDTCVQISGKLDVSNSEFKNVRKNGITIRQTGLVSFDKVSINSHDTSYILQGVDPNSTLSVQVWSLPSSSTSTPFFWFTVLVWPMIVLVLVVVVVFLIMKRKTTGKFSDELKSYYNGKSFSDRTPSNVYMPPGKTEEISMAAKAGKVQMGNDEDKKEGLSSRSPPQSSSNHTSAGTPTEHPSFPPPPLLPKQGPASDDQDFLLYVDADSEPPPPPPPLPENPLSPLKSALHQISPDTLSNTKPAAPFPKKAPNPGPPLQKPNLLPKAPAVNPLTFSNPLKPTSQLKAGGPHPPPPPIHTLPPSSHYAGRAKPKPPPRRGSEITTPPPLGGASDQAGAPNETPLYEDTVVEEPLYASEDELENY